MAAEWKDELAGRLKSLPPGRIWEEMAIKRDDIAILTAERDKREAVLQAEIDRLKAALEEKVLTSKVYTFACTCDCSWKLRSLILAVWYVLYA